MGNIQGTLNVCSAEILLREEITSILNVDLQKDCGGK